MTTPSYTHENENGFTIVEALVTIVVVAIFSGFVFQMYLVSESQRIAVARRATASDVAYSNLDKITQKSQAPACSNTMDLTVNADAPGVDLIATGAIPAEPINANLGPNVSQKLIITYPRGCGASTMPARVTSIVSYGNPSESIVHVSYVN